MSCSLPLDQFDLDLAPNPSATFLVEDFDPRMPLTWLPP